MAMDMFLKIEGIPGEAQDSSHKTEIDVLSWSWGGSQSGTTHVGGGGGAGKVSYQDLSVTKWVDSASHALLKHLSNGKHIASALLTVRKAGGTPIEYVKLEMKEVMVTSISTGGSGGEDRLTENIVLNFAEFTYTYTPQKPDGSADSPKPYHWNIQTNSE